MIGYDQQSSGAVFHLYRSPNSNPSFLDDAVQAFIDKVGVENTIAIRNFAFSLRPAKQRAFLIRSSRLLEAENSFTTASSRFGGQATMRTPRLWRSSHPLERFPGCFSWNTGGYAEGRDPDTNASRRGDRGVVSVLTWHLWAQTTCLRFCTMPPVKRRSVLPMMKPKRLDIWNLRKTRPATSVPGCDKRCEARIVAETGSLTSLSCLVGNQGFKAQVDSTAYRFPGTRNGLLATLESYATARAGQLHVAAAKLKDPGAMRSSAAQFGA